METIIANEGFLYQPKMLSRLKDIDPDLAERGIGNDHIESAMDKQAFYHKTTRIHWTLFCDEQRRCWNI